MINGKSHLCAAALNDIFSRLGWHRSGCTAMPTESATAVAVQYRSPQFGSVRVVLCDALGLIKWLKLHATQFGAKARFEELLDRKDSLPSAPVQQLLDLSAPIARRAMKP